MRPIAGAVASAVVAFGRYRMTFSKDGGILLVHGKIIRLWDTHSWRFLGGIAHQYINGPDVMAISSVGNILAVTGADREHQKYGDGTVELWSLRRRQLLAVIRGAHNNYIVAVAFSPDGGTLATAGWDRSIRLWDVSRLSGKIDGRVQTSPMVTLLNDRAGPVNCLAFSPDGKELVAGNEDRTLRVWDLGTHREHGVLTGHGEAVTSVFFSNANTLVSISAGGIRFWRAAPSSRTDDPQRTAWGRTLK